MPRKAAVICALRTPIGRYGGTLSSVRPDDLAAIVIRAVVERSGIDPTLIDDVYMGAANQAGEDNRNVARMSALLAGLPTSVPGSTVNRLCASGLEAINIAARMIEADHGDVFIAGGVESMSRAPLVMSKAESAFDRNQQIYDTSIGWRFINPKLSELHHPFSMGETAENVARDHQISRTDQDAFALWSQQKWAHAHAEGRFDNELVPVEIPQRKGDPIRFTTDEHPRPDTTPEMLAKLRPVFAKDGNGTVTAGNASGVNDGAAALLIMDDEKARSLGLTPIAYVGHSASAGVDPSVHGYRPGSRDPQSPEPGGHDPRQHRPLRAQRGIRSTITRMRTRAQDPGREAQCQRRRDRNWAPARVLGRTHRNHAHPRDDPHRCPARRCLTLCRCRSGSRDRV